MFSCSVYAARDNCELYERVYSQTGTIVNCIYATVTVFSCSVYAARDNCELYERVCSQRQL